MSIKNLRFIESYFNFSEEEALVWIDDHTQEDIDTIFDECMEDNPPITSIEEI